MKKRLSIVSILTAVLFVASAFSLRENPQDPPRGAKKHIKLIKVNNGEKVELDTMVKGDKVFVWNGDTICGKGLKRISEGGTLFKHDSLGKIEGFYVDANVTEGKGGQKFVVIKSGEDGTSNIQEFKIDGKSGNKFIYEMNSDDAPGSIGSGNAVWVDDEGNHTKIQTPCAPGVFNVPGINFSKRNMRGNVIDLSDPGIISFKKKKLSGGREKIEIIRNEVNGGEAESDVMIEKTGVPVMIHQGNPEVSKVVKIIREDGGVFNVFESDEDVLKSGEAKDRNVIIKEIKNEDGKIIHIQEIKEGNGKKVKVTVTEDVEKESKEKKEGSN